MVLNSKPTYHLPLLLRQRWRRQQQQQFLRLIITIPIKTTKTTIIITIITTQTLLLQNLKKPLFILSFLGLKRSPDSKTKRSSRRRCLNTMELSKPRPKRKTLFKTFASIQSNKQLAKCTINPITNNSNSNSNKK